MKRYENNFSWRKALENFLEEAPRVRGVSRINLGHLAVVSVTAGILICPFLFLCYIKTTDIYPVCWEGMCDNGLTDKYKKLVTMIIWSGALSLACASGCLGTMISFFLRQTSQEPINTGEFGLRRARAFIGLREVLLLEFFGAVFGMLMFGLFVGGFVQGSLFPSVIRDNTLWTEISIRTSSWAKIMIWCFIAGFSERLIPNLLDGLVRKVDPIPMNRNNGGATVSNEPAIVVPNISE